MTHHERLPRSIDCSACGTPLPLDRVVSLEVSQLREDLAVALRLLDDLKPDLITASYYLDQLAQLLRQGVAPDAEDAATRTARETQARALSAALMATWCRSSELLALRRR